MSPHKIKLSPQKGAAIFTIPPPPMEKLKKWEESKRKHSEFMSRASKKVSLLTKYSGESTDSHGFPGKLGNPIEDSYVENPTDARSNIFSPWEPDRKKDGGIKNVDSDGADYAEFRSGKSLDEEDSWTSD
eukprot:2049044-Ditylum_brightwellii.AAC.1